MIEQLELISREFEKAINNNDAAAVAELFAEDGVFVTHGGSFYGLAHDDEGIKPGIPNGTYVLRITGQILDPSGSGNPGSPCGGRTGDLLS